MNDYNRGKRDIMLEMAEADLIDVAQELLFWNMTLMVPEKQSGNWSTRFVFWKTMQLLSV